MPDLPISGLPASGALDAADLFPIDDVSTGVTKKLTGTQLRTFIGAQLYQGRSPAAPDDPTLPALDYPTGGGTLLQWDVGSAAWV